MKFSLFNLLIWLNLFFFYSIINEFSVFGNEDIVPSSPYTSARGAALGEAYLPLGDDVASALFYNPAVFGKISKKTQFELLNYSGYSDVGFTQLSSYNATSLSSEANTLAKSPGTWSQVGGQVLSTLGFWGIGLGVLTMADLGAESNGNGTITYRSLYQFIPAIGTGVRFFHGFLRFGYSLQWINEATGSQTVNSSSSIGFNQGLSQGSGFSNTLGMAIGAPLKFLPELNFVVRNALNTTYSSYTAMSFTSSSIGVPATQHMSYDTSFSIRPRLGRGTYMNMVIEDRDITNTSGVTQMDRISFGTEVVFKSGIFVRGGYGDGNPAAGLGLKGPVAQLSLTYYTEEIGTASSSLADTRYMFQYQMRAF